VKRYGQDLSNQLVFPMVRPDPKSTNFLPLDQSVAATLAEFISQIQQAYAILNANRDVYPAAARIDSALQAALVAAGHASQAATQGDLAGVKSNLREAINNLALSDVLCHVTAMSPTLLTSPPTWCGSSM